MDRHTEACKLCIVSPMFPSTSGDNTFMFTFMLLKDPAHTTMTMGHYNDIGGTQ